MGEGGDEDAVEEVERESPLGGEVPKLRLQLIGSRSLMVYRMYIQVSVTAVL